MINRFPKWTMKGGRQSLSQLKHLSCLTTLHIAIPDVKLIPKDIQFENLTRYVIIINDFWLGSRGICRTLKLKKVNLSLYLGDGIHKLLERSEELEMEYLSGTIHVLQYPSNRESFVELKHLQVSNSEEIEYIIDAMDQRVQEHGRPIPRGSLGNLKTLEMFSCQNLRYLFSLSTARKIYQLEKMKIDNCVDMEQIFLYEKESEDENGGTNLELFPNLRSLKLESLSKLINLCSELETNARSEDSSFSHKVC